MKDDKHIPDERNDGDHLPPILKDLQGKDPFAVPEGYFDELPGRIMQKIDQQPASHNKLRLLFRRPLVPVSLAAAMIGLLLMFYFLLKPGEHNVQMNYLAENNLEATAIEDYLLYTSSVDEDAIVDVMLDEQNAEALNLANPFDDGKDSIRDKNEKGEPVLADTTITRDDIINYLLDEDIDPDSDL